MTVAETRGLLFPGQGSQFVGMGRELAARSSPARETYREADDLLGFSLSKLSWEGPEEELLRTKNAQPAILAHSVAVVRALGHGIGPVSCAGGHSLGEFSAHVAAGTLAFSDALAAVRLRGELMFRAGEVRPGTMAAVLGLADDEIQRLCAVASDGNGVCVPANYNSAGQVVVSGDVPAVEHFSRFAHEAGAKRVIPLNVSGAFHSPLMKPAEDGLRAFLEGVPFKDPSYPVISNVTAEPVGRGDEARSLLVRQLTSPVCWAESVRTMTRLGARDFLELGPGKVLCGLNRRNAKGAGFRCRAIGEPTELEDFLGTSAG